MGRRGCSRRHRRSLWCSVCVAALLLLPLSAAPRGRGSERNEAPEDTSRATLRDAPTETLWIFDADFEDLSGDNAGWQSHDLSGGNVRGDYWHKDTIRIRDFTHLGDSTWWCGRYHNWWRQSRGYGNNWAQWLYREMPLSDWSDTTDVVVFEWDQRFAMENDYDYGYVDFSHDTGASWTTLGIYANNGFAGSPGMSHDWDSVSPSAPGHVVMSLSEFAGRDIIVRFRFESDPAYSSQDQYNNPPLNSVLDGAWQLDNFEVSVNDNVVWLDDCESPGENGWIHHYAPLLGEAGITFERAFEPDTHRGFTCDPGTGWMMAAVDPATGMTVDSQHSLLMTPPLDVEGASVVVVQWDMWHDFECGYGDRLNWGFASSDTSAGLDEQAHLRTLYGYVPTVWQTSTPDALEGPGWTTATRSVRASDMHYYLTELNWIAFGWWLYDPYPDPPHGHTAGAFLERVRVGTYPNGCPSIWQVNRNELWSDVFSVSEAEGRWVDVGVWDQDGLAAVRTIASNDSGQTWHAYDLSYGYQDEWTGPTPSELLAPATQILYYFEATDSLGNVSVWPESAPDELLEFTILPIHGSLADPGILIVDKRRARTPGDDRSHRHDAEYYLTEALDVLGYRYDVYDARDGYELCSGTWGRAKGPELNAAYMYYDTHIWLTGDMIRWTVEEDNDQPRLMSWLSDSTPESPHRLFLYGNNIGWDLIEKGNESGGFFTSWLGASYEDYHAGAYSRFDVPDTTVRVRDAGLGLMTHDDGECWLRCGCPDLQYVDVVSPAAGGGAQLALEYVNGLGEVRPAGVVKVDSLTGYRVVYLPFGIELMNDGLDGTGHYANGIEDRVNLVANVMGFLGESPGGPGTGAEEGKAFVTGLDYARPNPFNPTTTIEYSLAADCRVTIRVFDAAGRVVRTLVDSPVKAGPHTATWDGTTDTGSRAASGVYFIRMEVAGKRASFREVRKLVLLK